MNAVVHGADLRHCVSIHVFNRREEPADRPTLVSDHYLFKLFLSLGCGILWTVPW